MLGEHEKAKLKVFVSYSRADTRFADELVAGLEFDGGFVVTIDRHSIEKGEDWKARLGALIEAADTIVFVLSPASATSEICRWEVERAAELNKRILPVLHLPLAGVAPPPALGKINYVDFTVSPTLIAGIRGLASALRMDLGWLREATRLLNLAMDWERADRRDNRLLSGPDIVEAKKWLADCPPTERPTELHRDYIRASEAVEAVRLDVERARLVELATAQAAAAAQAKRVSRRTLVGLAVAVMLGLAAWGQAERAKLSELGAEATTREAQVTQSGLLSKAVRSLTDRPDGGDAPVAMLLALEGVPDAFSDNVRQARRVRVPEAQYELAKAYYANRERGYLAHDSTVWAVEWNSDGGMLATLSQGVGRPGTGKVRIAEVATGKEIAQVAHKGSVSGMAWSPDGLQLATWSSDLNKPGEVRVLAAATGREIARVEHDRGIAVVAWSPDGRFVATGSHDNTARVFETAMGREIFRVVHDGDVVRVAWSPNGRSLATGSRDKTVRIIEVGTGKEIARVVHEDMVTGVAWSPEGRSLATGSGDYRKKVGATRIVDAATGQDIAQVMHGGEVRGLTWHPDGRLIALGLQDNSALIINATTGSEMAKLALDSAFKAARWSPDGRRLAITSGDYRKPGETRIVDAETGNEVARVSHAAAVYRTAWSPDGRWLASGSGDDQIRSGEVWPAAGSVDGELS